MPLIYKFFTASSYYAYSSFFNVKRNYSLEIFSYLSEAYIYFEDSSRSV
jgi:hypothetical protein